MKTNWLELTKNPSAVPLSAVPVTEYPEFMRTADELMQTPSAHCLTYFACPGKDTWHFYCAIAEDTSGRIFLSGHDQPMRDGIVLPSLTARHSAFHAFEREIHEQYGIGFEGHPWLKPVRFPNPGEDPGSYPFYAIGGEELHEVGVGPIHAGIIEPGYFRFICNGEKVLHLEIRLGYQHRGIEKLFAGSVHALRRIVLSENIAGDTAVGHSLCHVQLSEALGNIAPAPELEKERVIALELERIAVHIGDTAALCTDIAYQLGQVVSEALRTLVINTLQAWCGNRFGKGLIRTGGSHYPLTPEKSEGILSTLAEVEKRYGTITSEIFSMTSVLNRFENTGRLTAIQARLLGAVGMAARSSGIERDIRRSHPFQSYQYIPYKPVVLKEGDVWARAMLRVREVESSVAVIRAILSGYIGRENGDVPVFDSGSAPSSFAISVTEGWRGEIVHAAVTDQTGKMVHYKIKDPSFHNWMALALAVRNQEISDFPVCNKSFNLSYCGHDL